MDVSSRRDRVEKEVIILEIDFNEEFNGFMWTIGRFLREKGYDNNPSELFCAATVAAWSLQHEQSKINDLVKDFKRKETQAAVKRYAECYKELQVIAAQHGREIVDYGMRNLDLCSPYISRRDNP